MPCSCKKITQIIAKVFVVHLSLSSHFPNIYFMEIFFRRSFVLLLLLLLLWQNMGTNECVCVCKRRQISNRRRRAHVCICVGRPCRASIRLFVLSIMCSHSNENDSRQPNHFLFFIIFCLPPYRIYYARTLRDHHSDAMIRCHAISQTFLFFSSLVLLYYFTCTKKENLCCLIYFCDK